jgi:DNA-binding NtrC family response regulator
MSKSVLIVDDEQDILDVLSLGMKRMGWDPVTIRNSSEVESFLKLKKCDVLILDLVMPRITGEKIYKKIKESNMDIKIIILSGHPERVMKAKEEMENVKFIKKPFEFKDLESILKEC